MANTSSPVRIVYPLDGGNLIIVSKTHAKIHAGEMWHSSYKSPDASPIADNGNFEMLIITGTRSAHLDYRVNSTQAYELAIYEDTVTTDNGTALARRNRNRTMANNKSLTLTYHTPTVSNAGTLLLNEVASGILGGVSRSEDEWELKANSKYLIRLINRAGSAQSMSIAVNWYEE